MDIIRRSTRSAFQPQVHERLVTKDGIAYAIVQLPPSKEFEVWLHKDNNPYLPPDKQSYYTGKLEDQYGNFTIYVEGGRVHRLDGPAVVRHAHNYKDKSYYIAGLKFTEREFWKYVKDTEYGDVMFAKKFGADE